VDLDATGPPFAIGRDLKEEGVSIRLPIPVNRKSCLSHSVSPDLRRSRQLRFQMGFSCGAIVTLVILA
ncbi:MAG: hypothetical protein Q7U92_11055, partial [Bradyrhizobium sp.]|nr:hypothetical protein [Bradyrhizobium sp.]